jgi:hypothetical protein
MNTETLEKKVKFIDAIKDGLTVTDACTTTKIARATYYVWYNQDEGFRDAVKTARYELDAEYLDLAETRYFNAIRTGEPWAIKRAMDRKEKLHLSALRPPTVDMDTELAEITEKAGEKFLEKIVEDFEEIKPDDSDRDRKIEEQFNKLKQFRSPKA